MKENIKILANRVKMLRMRKGVSQTRMAEEIGVSQTNLDDLKSVRVCFNL